MNQILKQKYYVFSRHSPIPSEKDNIENSNKYIEKKNITPYRIQFVISSIIASCFILFFFIRIFSINQNEKYSKQLVNQYHISTLYSNDTSYSAQLLNSSNSNNLNNSLHSFQNPFVIGMIKIDKINLNYPILSETSKDLLDVSLCRFAGPFPNEVGNLCIAGHNYVDYKLFSRLNELNLKDKIKIYDLNGQMFEYIVFKKYETSPDDTSCTSQETNGNMILTLLTCNNVNGKRLVVVAKPYK